MKKRSHHRKSSANLQAFGKEKMNDGDACGIGCAIHGGGSQAILDVAKRVKCILDEIPGSQSDCGKIGDYILQLKSGRINICVFGEFSAGKSSLINSLISYPLMPVADRPLTSIRTGIVHSEQPYLCCWWGVSLSSIAKNAFHKALSKIECRGAAGSSDNMGERISWSNDDKVIMSHCLLNALSIRDFLWKFEEEQYLEQDDVSKIERGSKRKDGRNMTKNPFRGIKKIEVGLPLPKGLRSVRLLDLPGEGSVYKYGSDINDAAEAAQIVLHVLDAEHVGDKLTDEIFAEGMRNKAMRVCVLNKSDTLSEESLTDALLLLQKRYRVKPIAVSALCENSSCLLSNNLCSLERLVLENRKVNLAQVRRSGGWNPCNLESNKPLVIKFLHDTSNCQELTDRLSKHVKQVQLRLVGSCSNELLRICTEYSHKIKAQIEAVERCQEQNALKAKICSLRDTCKGIDDFCEDAKRKFQFEAKPMIEAALEKLLKRFRNTLSNLLKLSFEELEDHLEDTIKSSFSFPVDCEIKNVVDVFFAQHRTRSEDCMTTLDLTLPKTVLSPVSWVMESNFSRQIQLNTCEAIRPILQDTTGRPWFSSVRVKKMDVYMRKKRQKCMRKWRCQMLKLFGEEENRIVDLYSKALEKKLLPFAKSKKKIESDLKAAESALAALEKDVFSNKERIHLCKIHCDLNKQIVMLNSEGGKL